MKPFKNLSLFRVEGETETLDPFTPCRPLDESSCGWLPIRDDRLTLDLGLHTLLEFQTETKLLPPATLKRMAAERAAKVTDKPTRVLLRQIQEDLRTELLPQALTVRQTTGVWIDHEQKLLIIDSLSAPKTDLIREYLPGLVITPVNTADPVVVMAEWIFDGRAPDPFLIEVDCRLASDGGGAIACTNLDVTGAEWLRDQMREGLQPKSLGLTFNDRVSFTLRHDGRLARLALTEYALNDQPELNDDDHLEADMLLMIGEFQPLITAVLAALDNDNG